VGEVRVGGDGLVAKRLRAEGIGIIRLACDWRRLDDYDVDDVHGLVDRA
jgi:hypothetical protein